MQDLQNAEEYNKHLDKLLTETEMLTKELFIKFYDAYSYDSATTHASLPDFL